MWIFFVDLPAGARLGQHQSGRLVLQTLLMDVCSCYLVIISLRSPAALSLSLSLSMRESHAVSSSSASADTTASHCWYHAIVFSSSGREQPVMLLIPRRRVWGFIYLQKKTSEFSFATFCSQNMRHFFIINSCLLSQLILIRPSALRFGKGLLYRKSIKFFSTLNVIKMK